ncbi:MAG: cell division protein FtsQ/DivIB [Ilumatobacteraceae bacterium]
MKRNDLPGQAAPSPEVLDELLRAFSADTVDEERRQRVDLTSPEVDELLSASPTASPKVLRGPAPPPPAEVEMYVEEAAPVGPTVDVIDEPGSSMPPGDPLLAASAGADTQAMSAQIVTDGRILIDDSTATDSISVEEAVAATRIEPRMRERRIAVKRAKGRKRLKWFLIVFFAVALIVAALAVLGSSLFAIEDVEVDGADRTDPAALEAVIDELRGSPVLRVDTDAAEVALEAIPWVQDARVTTKFPHGAHIELRERTGVASFEGPDGSFRTIDPEGRVLEVVGEAPVGHLLVTSEATPDVPAGQYAPPGFRAAGSLLDALTPEMRAVAASVSVNNDGSDVRLLLTDGVEVRFGAGQELVAKLVRLQTWLNTGRGDGAVTVVDVSTDEVTSS